MPIVTVQTADDVFIKGDWKAPVRAARAVLLLHMMPATRKSFAGFAAFLNKAGFATLAIDLRGHGESTAQGSKFLDYRNFTDHEHQASRLDVDAAVSYFKKQGFEESGISFVGASIGANLSLDALHRYASSTHAVVLSPGLDYRGVRTDMAIQQLNAQQKILIYAAVGDTYSAESSKKLQELNPKQSTLSLLTGSEHGTNIFAAQESKLFNEILEFLSA